MNLRPGIVLQARYASSRLPGKALKAIGRYTVLEHCLTRLLLTGINRVVLATTRRPEDDALVAIAERVGVRIYRGSTEDVLGRVAAAAETYDLDPVIRATGDNPAVDPSAGNRLLQAIAHTGADYVHESGLPVGAGLEAMTAAALHYAASEATSAFDREHVTTFIKSHPNTFRLKSIAAPRELTEPSLSLTVDTAADLDWVGDLFARVDRLEPALSDLIAAGRVHRREVA
jgi:spore coat polysaccharide biosynthesis protein SpsF